MLQWQNNLYTKVQRYITRSLDPNRGAHPLPGADSILLTWWHTYGPQILAEFDEVVDTLNDAARRDELVSLATIIESDANIDNDDPSVQRIVHTIRTFIEELDQEVEYETAEDLDQAGESHQGMEKDS